MPNCRPFVISISSSVFPLSTFWSQQYAGHLPQGPGYTRKHCYGSNIALEAKTFLCSWSKICVCYNVSHAAKQGNICIGNSVSYFSQAPMTKFDGLSSHESSVAVGHGSWVWVLFGTWNYSYEFVCDIITMNKSRLSFISSFILTLFARKGHSNQD